MRFTTPFGSTESFDVSVSTWKENLKDFPSKVILDLFFTAAQQMINDNMEEGGCAEACEQILLKRLGLLNQIKEMVSEIK